MVCVSSEDSDQPGHPPSLIRVFDVCMKKAWVQHTVKTLSQTGWMLGIQSFCWFCHEAAHFTFVQKEGTSTYKGHFRVIKLCV